MCKTQTNKSLIIIRRHFLRLTLFTNYFWDALRAQLFACCKRNFFARSAFMISETIQYKNVPSIPSKKQRISRVQISLASQAGIFVANTQIRIERTIPAKIPIISVARRIWSRRIMNLPNWKQLTDFVFAHIMTSPNIFICFLLK